MKKRTESDNLTAKTTVRSNMRQRPVEGGSYTRDPLTGKLTRNNPPATSAPPADDGVDDQPAED